MKQLRWFVLVVVSLVVISSSAKAQESQLQPAAAGAPSDSVLELWAMMRGAAMIDAEQFQYVLEHGRLPGGSTVQNSPVSERRQQQWAKLSEEELVTPEELANMLFKGKIPNMEGWEVKALEDLALVYEPDRRKRLTYDVRRKHIVVDVIRLKHRSREEWEESHAEALEWAKRTDCLLYTSDAADE